MSEYKTVDCLGWWEDKFGNRIKVIGIDGYYRAFLYKENGCVKGDCVDIMSAKKYLPECTGWNWQPDEWEDVDPTKITLSMLPIEARFRNELTEDWWYSKVYGYWSNANRYQCATTTWWDFCQVKKGVQK